MTDEQKDNVKKAGGWLVGLLTGWGIKESWAKIIAGAVLGAAVAWLAATGSGCTATYSQNADGSLNYAGSIVLPEPPPVQDGK